MVIGSNTNKANLQHLREDLEAGKKMVLFLGAGINLGDQIDDQRNIDLSWNGLMNGLFMEAFSLLSIGKNFSHSESETLKHLICNKDIKSSESKLQSYASREFPYLVQASIIKSVLGNNYINSIRRHLYQWCDNTSMKEIFYKHYSIDKDNKNKEDSRKKPFYALYQLARLIILHHSIIAVVTYNFDKFLTMAIEILTKNPNKFFTPQEINKVTRNRTVVDVFGSDIHSFQKKDIIPIYHIHGFIPPYHEFLPLKDNEIVLSMEEFYENTQNVYSWQTATQLHFLCHFTCLFIGISLTDINTQRMIHYASKIGNDDKIYYLHAASKEMEKTGRELDEKEYKIYLKLINLKDTFYAKYGLTPIFDKEGYNHMYETILNFVK